MALAELRGFADYARSLPRFLAQPLSVEDAYRRIAHDLATREERFLTLLGGVLADPRSPYRLLFEQGGIELGDVAALVRADGVEAALRHLRAAGVWLSLAETRGKEPVRRGDWSLQIDRGALANRFVTGHFQASTGGSRSRGGTTFWVDLRDVLQSSAYAVLLARAFGLVDRRAAIWFPAPPGVAGMRRALWWSKSGVRLERWFAQTVPRWRPGELRRAAFVSWTVGASRRTSRPLPAPERTSPTEALRVARWLAESGPGVLFSTPSSGVRVCEAARAAGLDLAGAFFSFGGEAYTEAKNRVIRSAGASAESSYYVSELGGPLALACPAGEAFDHAHVADDRIAVIDEERTLSDGRIVRPLLVTTISPFTPQVAINLEIGDSAVHGRASCGCPFHEAGLKHTLHTIRSYDKLSTEGMHFVGPQLVALLEDVLPRRFGGGPTDYQLVEAEDERGRSRILLAVAPRLGPIDEVAVAEAALGFLGSEGPAERMMADIWGSGGTLTVVRREPEVSRVGKVLPLHVER
ncbi:MAG TPA: hypothetical protein VF101_12210 [Gaiellaceae bacterium]